MTETATHTDKLKLKKIILKAEIIIIKNILQRPSKCFFKKAKAKNKNKGVVSR